MKLTHRQMSRWETEERKRLDRVCWHANHSVTPSRWVRFWQVLNTPVLELIRSLAEGGVK